MSETIGKTRITKLGEAIVRAGGIVSFETAMAMLGENKQATWRALEWLVKAGMLRKIRTPGGCHVWMSERTLVRTFNPKEKPAVNKLSRKKERRRKGRSGTDRAAVVNELSHTKERWVPGPTFEHDQLALRVLFSLAESSDLLTEHEIRSAGTWRGRIPDGVLRLTDDFTRREVLAELEVETSRKTGAISRPSGTQGGGAKLADRLYRVCHNWFDGPQSTKLGRTDTTLIVAPPAHVSAIRKKIAEVERGYQAREPEHVDRPPGGTIWYYSELLGDGTFKRPEIDLLI